MPLGKSDLTKIGTFYVSYTFVILFFWNQRPWNLFCLHFVSQILCLSLFFILKKVRQRQFNKEFLRFSSLLLLKMKMGYGFRNSYEQCLIHAQWDYQLLLGEIYENVVFSPQEARGRAGDFDSFLRDCENLFYKVDCNPSAAIEQLESFRKELLKKGKFRRRSGQIWGQIVSQWVIISGIYLGFLVYSLREFEFSAHKWAFLISISLHLLGILALLRLRKVPKWKL